MALREFLSVLCPDCKCVSTSLLEIMEGVSASILQSAQNVKVKLLSIIRGVSTKLLLTYLQNPLPLPQQFKRDPLGKRGFWVGINLVKCRKKNANLTCH